MNTMGTRPGCAGPLAWLMSAVLVVALAACGGGSKPASAPSTSSKPSASTTAPSSSTAAADKATAQSLVLVQADLPAGWVGSADESDAQDAELNRKLALCAGATDPTKQTADVTGLDFDKGEDEVGSEATLAPSRGAFETDMAALRGTKYETCLKTLFNTQLKAEMAKESPGVVVSNLTLARFPTPTYGKVTVGLRLSATVTGPTGKAVQLHIDEIQYGKGRSEVSLTFSAQAAPFDPVLERSLTAKAVAKLETLPA